MSVYKVGSDRPLFLSGVFTRPYLVKNNGNTIVYLGQDSSLSVDNRSMSLPPQGSLNWGGSTELWAITANDLPGEVEIIYESSGSFSAGATVNLSNRPVLIENREVELVQTISPTAQSFGFGIDDDIASFSSLIFKILPQSAAPQSSVSIANFVNLEVAQFLATDSQTFGLTRRDDAQWLLDTANSAFPSVAPGGKPASENGFVLQVPVTGNKCDYFLKVVYNALLASPFRSLRVLVFGSGQQIDGPRYISDSLNLVGTLAMGGAFSENDTAVGFQDYYPASLNKLSHLNLIKRSTGGQGDIALSYIENGVQIVIATAAFFGADGQNTMFVREVNLPARPLHILRGIAIAGLMSLVLD